MSLKTTMIELSALLQDPRPSPTLLGRPYAIPPARKTTSKPPQVKTRGLQPCNRHYPSADSFSTAIFTPPLPRRLSSAHSGTPSAQLQTRRIAPDWSKLASADLHPWASTILQLDRMVTAWDGSFAGPAWIRSAWIDRGLTRGFLLLLAHEGYESGLLQKQKRGGEMCILLMWFACLYQYSIGGGGIRGLAFRRCRRMLLTAVFSFPRHSGHVE